MFVLNKKNGNIQECHNADAVKVCQKDTDHYAVAATREALEGKAQNKPQGELKEHETGENTKEPENPVPEGSVKATEGDEERLEELNEKKVPELMEIAKEMGIKGYTNMNKDTLIAMIMNH